ncbi:hypothetical protein EYF80_028500 [Liparis tanakae]|uniref:Uncharacterized protein n=1 Tax=Liparis tanakae TaxID=230148 RepID=A0A4Z2H5Y9_9TELE|nr:hypothetical protein EYF80_028500 [Liparis tanakae]
MEAPDRLLRRQRQPLIGGPRCLPQLCPQCELQRPRAAEGRRGPPGPARCFLRCAQFPEKGARQTL